jgi:hypothetical protein
MTKSQPVRGQAGQMKLHPSYLSLSTALCLFLTSPAAQASWCDAEGAFGFKFGDRVPAFSTRLSGGDASIWYQVKPPKPDPTFNLYLARVDTSSAEIFEVVAQTTVSPQYSRPPETFTASQREEGKALAIDAVSKLYQALPEDLRQKAVVGKYDSHAWEIRVSQDVLLKIDTSIPTDMSNWAWVASASCKHISREWALAKRVMPELFEKSKK